jgi:hypothetical protein
MPYDELIGWINYFEKRPVDWRADDRAYKLLCTQGVKEKPWRIFSSLNPIYNAPKSYDDKLDINSFKASGFFSKIMSAKGGETIPYD